MPHRTEPVHRIDYAAADPLIKAIKEAEPKVSAAEIARRLKAKQIKIGHDAVIRRLAQLGFKNAGVKGWAQRFPARDAELIAHHEAGKSIAQIAAAMEISKTVVGKRCAELDLKKRGVLPLLSEARPAKKKPSQSQQTFNPFPNGYPRPGGEIPPNIRTLPILPSISGPEFGNAFSYDAQLSPVVLSSGGDDPGGSSGSDPSSSD